MNATDALTTILHSIEPEVKRLSAGGDMSSKMKADLIIDSFHNLSLFVKDIQSKNNDYSKYPDSNLEQPDDAFVSQFFPSTYKCSKNHGEGEININQISASIFTSATEMLKFRPQFWREGYNSEDPKRWKPAGLTLEEALNYSRYNTLSMFGVGYFGPVVREHSSALYAVRMSLGMYAVQPSSTNPTTLADVEDIGRQLLSDFCDGDTRRSLSLRLGYLAAGSVDSAVHEEAITILASSLTKWNISENSKLAISFALKKIDESSNSHSRSEATRALMEDAKSKMRQHSPSCYERFYPSNNVGCTSLSRYRSARPLSWAQQLALLALGYIIKR